MIELNGWLFVIGDDYHTPNVDVYILKGDGTNKKLIKRFVAAGGGY